MSYQAFVLTKSIHRESTGNDNANQRFVAILPSCGFSITSGPITPSRSVLIDTHTLFIDANYCSQASILNLSLISDFPHLNIIVFNVPEENTEFHYAALQKGINGIFHVNDSLELIVRGAQQIQKGNKWFSREVMSRYIDANLSLSHTNNLSVQTPNNVLTKRELAITQKITEGAQNQEIADNFHISVNTVKTHVYSIFRKTECRNRVELIKWFDNQFNQIRQIN